MESQRNTFKTIYNRTLHSTCPYTHVYIPLSIYLCAYTYMSIYLCPCTYVHIPMCIYLCPCPFNHVPIYVHIPILSLLIIDHFHTNFTFHFFMNKYLTISYSLMNICLTFLLYIWSRLCPYTEPIWPIGR